MPESASKVVNKRDGTTVPWDSEKPRAAARAALLSCGAADVEAVVDEVGVTVDRLLSRTSAPSVEEVQNAVETALMTADQYEAARAFILYRQRRAEVRADGMAGAIAAYTHAAKYASNNPDGTLESRSQSLKRVQTMHRTHYSMDLLDLNPGVRQVSEVMYGAFRDAEEMRVQPSMRSMQFGGDPILRNNTRMYNCAFTLINRKRVFGEVFYALLCGAGVGYSVQYRHVNLLPKVLPEDEKRVRHHVVEDSIEGWADAMNALARARFETGEYVEFSYHLIRSLGSPISSGGTAPGHLPLKRALEAVRALFDDAERGKLRPVHAHDMICHLAEAVFAGGVRRASLLALFSPEDDEMLYAKTAGNFRPAGIVGPDGAVLPPVNDQRQRANNSMAILRSRSDAVECLRRVFDVSKESWGEPGAYMHDHPDHGPNPCGEIGLHPVLLNAEWNGVDRSLDFDWRRYGDGQTVWRDGRLVTVVAHGPTSDLERVEPAAVYGHSTGFQFCNLTEVNAAACRTAEEFIAACESAAVIGTLQAGYTTFTYMGPVTEAITRRDALLGVGLTGVMDNPTIALDPTTLRAGAAAVMSTNAWVADRLGLSRATRCTTVKPSGTSSLVLGCVGSGCHPHHSTKYFRRVNANVDEPWAVALKAANPHMVEPKPDGTWSIVFAIRTPEGAVTWDGMTGPEFMESVFTLYDNWVAPGTRSGTLTHNVSCTVTVGATLRSDDPGAVDALAAEWAACERSMIDNLHRVAAMAFFPSFDDHLFPFAPRMAVRTDDEERRWAQIAQKYSPVDYGSVRADVGNRTLVAACDGDACEIESTDRK